MAAANNAYESYMSARLEFEIKRLEFDDELLGLANAGEIEMDMENPITRCMTNCEGNSIPITIYPWKETNRKNWKTSKVAEI